MVLQRIGRPTIVLKMFHWACTNNRSLVFVICHNSLPYNKIGRQKVLYSLCVVMGCRQPNLEPTALQLKKALLPALQCSEVRADDDGETVRRIPRWCWLPFSGIFSPETNHCHRGRFFARVGGDSQIGLGDTQRIHELELGGV